MNHTNDTPYSDFWRKVSVDSRGEVIDTGKQCYELHVYNVTAGMNSSIGPCCSRKGDLHGVVSVVFRHCPRFHERLKKDTFNGLYVGLTDFR